LANLDASRTVSACEFTAGNVNIFSFFFGSEDGGEIPPKHWLTSSELQGVIYHKTKFLTFRIRQFAAIFLVRRGDHATSCPTLLCSTSRYPSYGSVWCQTFESVVKFLTFIRHYGAVTRMVQKYTITAAHNGRCAMFHILLLLHITVGAPCFTYYYCCTLR
jgi:hypothetical protein